MKWASIDFEYNSSKEKKLNLVCGVIRTASGVKRFWLHNSGKGINFDKRRMLQYIAELHEQGYIFLAYAVTAEARSFLGMDLDPLKYNWIDLYLEYRCLTNHNHNYMYGKQYKDGKVKFTKMPKNKWERTEEEDDDANGDKPNHSMAAACYKTIGIQIDTAFKKATRDLIISNPREFTDEERDQILEYCADDTEHLYPMFVAMVAEYKRLLGRRFNQKDLKKEMLWRSEYSCRTAVMEELGYPLDLAGTKNFSDQVGHILFSCQREIIEMFPDRPPFYKFKKKEGIYTLNQSAVREEIRRWVKSHPRIRWMLTDGGKSGKKDLSLSLKAFTKHFNYTHSYPEGNYFAQIVRFLKLKQNLNGFTTGGKTNFWDYVGSDGFCRPYMGIYTAQSSRSQPKASSFIPLKSAWMRCMISPPKGYAMASIDYKSQEFLIAALLSGDKNMIRDYLTGDVYLAFGRSCGFIPKTGTKADHAVKRNQCKPIVLGIQFDMSKYGLSKDLTEKWGKVVTPDQAQVWIDKHKKAYPTLWAYKARLSKVYGHQKFIKLPDGWYMWGDNPNFRSVGNVPVQGLGACIMRKAVQLSQDDGIELPYTLHDALYLLCKIAELPKKLKLLAYYMDKAFRFYFPETQQKIAQVGLEADVWSTDFPKEVKEYYVDYKTDHGLLPMEVKQQHIYIDPRGKKEYDKFKQYFKQPILEDLETMEF